MKYTVKPSVRFQKDLKRIEKRRFKLELLTEVIKMLANGEPLPEKYRDHALTGNFASCRECHIQNDWLLVYEITESDLILYLTHTGSHSDLFR